MRNAGAKILVFQYAENPFVTRMWMKGFVRYARTVRGLVCRRCRG